MQPGEEPNIIEDPLIDRPDCELFMRGECPHGMSGKTGGICEQRHRKRCNKFLTWGNKHTNGCRDEACAFLHPTLCERSMDLECLEANCPSKLHTRKCKRPRRPRQGRIPEHQPQTARRSNHDARRPNTRRVHDMSGRQRHAGPVWQQAQQTPVWRSQENHQHRTQTQPVWQNQENQSRQTQDFRGLTVQHTLEATKNEMATFQYQLQAQREESLRFQQKVMLMLQQMRGGAAWM